MNLMDLFIKIGVDDEASGKIKSITQSISDGLAKAAKIGAAAIGATVAAAGALGAAFVKGANEIATYGDNIDKMSQKLGISAQAYQEWDAILQHSGTTIDGMQRGMMSLAQAAEKGSDAFQQIGISQEQVASMSQEELFAATIEGLQGMEEGSERAVLAQKLLGGAAKELGPLLNTSTEETEAMRQRVHELGGVMSDEAVKAAAKYKDSLQDLKTAFRGLKNNMMHQFLPSITKVMDGLTMILSGDRQGGIGAISEGIKETASQISEVLPEIINILVENTPALVEAAITIIKAVIKGVAEAIPEMFSSIWDAVDKAISESSFGERWESIKEAVSDAVEGIKESWDKLKEKLQPLIDKVGEAWQKFKDWEEENKLLEKAIGFVGVAISSLVELASVLIVGFDTAWGAVKDGASTAAGWILDKWGAVSSFFSGLADKIANLFGISGTAEAMAMGMAPVYNWALGKVFNGGPAGHSGTSHAIGADYVPYNGYPAILHRGEAVLTAREADAWRRGNSGNAVENVFNFYGVSQSDLDYIVDYVNRGLA